MPASSDIFLSYPHADKAAVLDLVAALRAEGLAVWLDETDVGAFEHIHDRVAAGIAGSRAVVAWYSRRYAASRPCQWELSAAWLCEDGERILVLNPEPGDTHIQPRTLLRRAYAGPARLGDLAALAREVKSHVARFADPIGDRASFSQPLHYGRQLAGSNHFVGRQGQFWALHEALTESRATMLTGAARSVVQLRGFGGVGKSVLAEEYALRFGAAYPGGVFWLRAYGNDEQGPVRPKDREGERLRQLSEFAAQLHIPTEGMPPPQIEAALARVLAADFESGRGSLWVVDDVPTGLTADALSEWFSPHACVPTLVTTRDRSHSSLGRLLDLDVLSAEESFALLETHRRVEDSEREAARELLAALGHHALAVEVTASFLADQRSVSFRDFAEALRDPGADVLEQAAELADALPLDHSPSILATLRGTIARLDEPARDLLCLASCLAAAPVPKELIEGVLARLGAAGPLPFLRMRAAKEAERFALGRRESAPADALSFHPLVARTARRHPDLKERLDRIRPAAVASLTETLLGMVTVGSVLRQSLTITHARALASPLTTAAEALLLVHVAGTDLIRGDVATGERLARRALDFCRAALGEDATETFCAQGCVGMAMFMRGDTAGARQIYGTVIEFFERTLPPGDRFRLGAQAGLAMIALAQGDLPTARRYGEGALDACAAAHGPDDPTTLNLKVILAQILAVCGDAREAARLQQEVNEARRRVAGRHDVDRITDEFLAARTKMGAGEHEAAAPFIEEAVEVFQREFGEDNLLTLNAKLCRLMLLGGRGDIGAARQLAGELIPRLERMYGPKNLATLQARFAEALPLLTQEGGGPAALSLIEPVVTEMEAMLGPDHPEVFYAKLCLAHARRAAGDSDGARRFLEALIPAVEARLGPAHSVTLDEKACLALCLSDQGDHAGACKVWEEVASVREGLLGSDHPQVLGYRASAALSLALLGEYERCRELLRHALPLAESSLGPEHSLTQTFKYCLAVCSRE